MWKKILVGALLLGAFLFVADKIVQRTTGYGIFERLGY
jgi:hypothetical protein